MTMAQLEKRLKKVEQVVGNLARSAKSPNWYRTHAGRFAGDAVFDEIVTLGRQYRESQRPRAKD